MIGSENENGSETKDILNNNKTSKESNKMFVTMQGKECQSEIYQKWKS